MSYSRVIPRDLFNEGDLLKCYGQIYLNLENMVGVDASLAESEDTRDGYQIEQDQSTGGISIANVVLTVRGEVYQLERPLNARGSYPLYMHDHHADEDVRMFRDDGSFTHEMRAFLKGE